MFYKYVDITNWGEILSIPYYYFYYYIPRKLIINNISFNSKHVRELIWAFKAGDSIQTFKEYMYLKQIQNEIVSKIYGTFTNTKDLTFVCIPASTIKSNQERYETFSKIICYEFGMKNGFEHISMLKEKTPSHLGGTDEALYELNPNFFKGKKVLLFDDLVTRGKSMVQFINLLKEVDAEVVCCMSIGLTFFAKSMNRMVSHPWDGCPVFDGGFSSERDRSNVRLDQRERIRREENAFKALNPNSELPYRF